MGKEKKVYFQTEESKVVIDKDTGEVISGESTKTTSARLSTEPPFVKLYLDCLAEFKDIQHSFNPILFELLKKINYADEDDPIGGLTLCINKWLKQKIATKCGVSLKRVDQAITEFVKKGYMYRIDVGTYQFNADLFGRGSWKNIHRVREIQATFNFKSGQAVATIVRDEEESMNKATDEIAEQSREQLTLLQKKKLLDEFKANPKPVEEWSDLELKLRNEEVSRNVIDTSRPYPEDEVMYLFESYPNWTFEQIAEHTGYSIEFVEEVDELYQYLKNEQTNTSND